MSRTITALAAVAMATCGTFALASPASATDPEPHYAAGGWQLRDWEGPYPDVVTSDAAASTATCDTVTLTKPDVPGDADPIYGPSSDGDVGTSYENTDLALPVDNGDALLADYELSDVAITAAGAVRMFAYDSADADTLNVAPTFGPYIVPGTSATGTAELAFTGPATIGTFGLTYDASNDTEGTVVWTNLRLIRADQSVVPISFCAEPEPMPSESTTPGATATSSGGLAVTGSSLTGLVGAAVVLVAAGGLALVLARRRRAREQ